MFIDVKQPQRDLAIRRRLELRREQIRRATRERMREAQQQHDYDGAGGLDLGDVSVSDVREDLDFALIELQTETLTKIDQALDRIAAGTYGWCADCGGEIAARRLEALPFATRCRACEERREVGGRLAALPLRPSAHSHAQ